MLTYIINLDSDVESDSTLELQLVLHLKLCRGSESTPYLKWGSYVDLDVEANLAQDPDVDINWP